ncbi:MULTISPECIES: KamA family radical SAM protein [Pantoea]|uniref:KamA family radical SAM protein n=1 Tax=Pantoea TaxID=53335 RepID=UPI001F17BD9C|nr:MULTISPECIES: radical SAM protein [Pantoea]UIL51320.1 radical SAM protein [Pantoea agglomerans]
MEDKENNKVFAQKTTKYLDSLMEKSSSVKAMYQFNPDSENPYANVNVDLLNEKKSSPVAGAVKKYEGQLLVLLSYTCAANCRYCERQDRVGVGLDVDGWLRKEQINNIVNYIKSNPDIYEVIASGGDPLMNPKGLQHLFSELRKIEHIKVVRIHTRLPLQNPGKINWELMGEIVTTTNVVYLSLHIDHPDELRPEIIDAINRFRKMGYILLTQTVFLKSVNDNKDVLKQLFLKLFELGVRPYYIYHGQEVYSTRSFVMSLDDEIKIMTELRNELSGLAFPQHVIDIPKGIGKVIIPGNHWDFNSGMVRDFTGVNISTDTWEKCDGNSN